jgi:N,N'-diacetyllegionaminate synthase
VRIDGVPIGPGEPVYVIAEIGGNHDGDLDQAGRLIQAAADAGADAAKFQFYRADKLYPGKHTDGAIPDWWLPELKRACHGEGVEFLCSVFDLETLYAYLEVEPAAVKIASAESTNDELLEAASVLPMLVSTGALDWAGTDSVDRVLKAHCAEYVLLHCVAAYPAGLEHLGLRVVGGMVERYGCPVGFSDHSLNPCLAPVVAVSLGACVVEKHLTLDRRLPGPDHRFALEPGEFQMMVDAVRSVPAVLGDGVKRVTPGEDATDRRAA